MVCTLPLARVVLAEDWIEDLMLRGALLYEVELVAALALASAWSAARLKAPRGLEVILGVRAVADSEPDIGAKRSDGEREEDDQLHDGACVRDLPSRRGGAARG